MEKKYFIYARKSSEGEEKQVLSVPSQIDELKILADKLSLQVKDILWEAKSAKVPNQREKFKILLRRIEQNEAEGIIVWHPDRLSRNPEESAAIVSLIDDGKLLEVITPTQTFRNNPMDKFFLGFLMLQAKLDNDTKGVNVKRGLEAKAKNGWLPSGAKAGYANDKFAEKGNKRILPDPIRFPLVRKAWDAMLTGTYTVMQILNLLNNEWGYRTPKHKKIGGKPMTRSQIYKTFTDPFYYGEFEYPEGSGIWRQGKHKPMISKEEFDRVQMLLGRKGRPSPRTRTFAYTGLIECGECGANITAEEKFQVICPVCKQKFASLNKNACPKCKTLIESMKKPTFLHYVYYHCTKRKDPHCTQKSIRVELLEKQLDKLLSNIQISERFKEWAIKYINELNDKEETESEATLKSLQATRANCETQLNNLLKFKISPQNADGSLLGDEEYKKQKELLIAERNKIDEKLGGNNYNADKWRETAEKTFDFACRARYSFQNGDLQTRREVLSGLGSNLTLIDKTVRINLGKPLQFIETALQEEPTISEKFEPENKIDNTFQLEPLWAQNPTLLRS